MEEGIKKHGPLHKDLAKTGMKQDTGAIGPVLKWLEETTPLTLIVTNSCLYPSLLKFWC